MSAWVTADEIFMVKFNKADISHDATQLVHSTKTTLLGWDSTSSHLTAEPKVKSLHIWQQLLLTCMFVCELDEAVRDVSPSVETNHLGLHIPAGRLKQKE